MIERLTSLSLDDLHIIFVGMLWLVSIPVLIWSMPRVSRWRRPLYWIAIPVATLMAGLYGGVVVSHILGVEAVLPWDRGLILRIALFLLSLEFYLVPYVDRLEARTSTGTALINAQAENLRNQLTLDQQTTMDEQHLVMGEQRQVMREQREGREDDR